MQFLLDENLPLWWRHQMVRILSDLVLIAGAALPDEFRDTITHLPLR